MIEKPSHSDFHEPAGIAVLRSAGQAAEHGTRGIRRFGREAGTMAFWSYGVPFAAMAALYVLQWRWPEIFQTLWAYLALVALFAWFVWKYLYGPQMEPRMRERLQQIDGIEDTSAMREALEAQWRDRDAAP